MEKARINVVIALAVALGAAVPAHAQGRLLVCKVNGDVGLRRAGWQRYLPLKDGAAIGPSDALQWTSGGSVQAFCLATKRLERITSPTVHPRCSPGTTGRTVLIEGFNYDPPRADSLLSSSIPILLMPRAGKVLTQMPLIRWKAVAGVQKYTVSLEQPDWSVTTSTTSLQYPATAPKLNRGQEYSFNVEANGARSSDEQAGGNLFRVASAVEARQIFAELARIDQQHLPAQSSLQSKLAVIISHEFYVEAQRLFDSSAAARSAYAYELIGSMDVTVELPREAERTFLEGIRRAEADGDQEERAVLARKLGAIYRSLGNSTAANQRLNEALTFYRDVQDGGTVTQLEQSLAAVDANAPEGGK